MKIRWLRLIKDLVIVPVYILRVFLGISLFVPVAAPYLLALLFIGPDTVDRLQDRYVEEGIEGGIWDKAVNWCFKPLEDNSQRSDSE